MNDTHIYIKNREKHKSSLTQVSELTHRLRHHRIFRRKRRHVLLVALKDADASNTPASPHRLNQYGASIAYASSRVLQMLSHAFAEENVTFARRPRQVQAQRSVGEGLLDCTVQYCFAIVERVLLGNARNGRIEHSISTDELLEADLVREAARHQVDLNEREDCLFVFFAINVSFTLTVSSTCSARI